MASQSLYRKWRSQTFSDLIGQEAVTRTLLNAVRDGRLAHAYLFCGPRGTGKTSTARLLAKAINCANPHNGEPCNECVSCREITGGRSPDVIEIDAASNTGVDNIRDLRENVALMSSGGHYRVFTIDEVHMLSTAAFNALLKTLEEPPPHVIFVLATTEAHKVLPTVVSRCQRFDFRRITMRDIMAWLDHVAQGEGLTLEPAAAELLARSAQGGMRDALSLLDQAVAFCGDEITSERVRQMLGLADAATLRTLIGHVAARRAAEGLDLINDLVASGADLRQLNAQLIEEWRALMLARAGADVARLMDRTDEDGREITALADQFTLDQLMACARIFTRNEGPARGLPIPQLALELVFLECVSACDPARPASAAATMTSPTPAVAAAHATQSAAYTPTTSYAPSYTPPSPPTSPAPQPPRPQPAAPTPVARPATPTPPPVETLDLAMIDRGESAPGTPGVTNGVAEDNEWGDTSEDEYPGAWDEADAAPAEAPAIQDEPVAATSFASSAPLAADEQAPEQAPPPASPASEASRTPERDWLTEAQHHWTLVKKICKQRPGQGATVGALLSHAYPILMEPGQPGEPPTIILQAKYKFHADGLRDPAKREIIEWALEQALEAPIRVRIVQEGAAIGPGVSIGRGSAPQTPAPPARAPRATPPAPPAPAPAAPSLDGFESAERSGQRIVREGRDEVYAPTPNGQNGHSRDGLAGQAPKPTKAAKSTPSQQALEEQARADPVVQELTRLLGAEVAEVRSLDAPDGDEPDARG